jgi:hypothetical protein
VKIGSHDTCAATVLGNARFYVNYQVGAASMRAACTYTTATHADRLADGLPQHQTAQSSAKTWCRSARDVTLRSRTGKSREISPTYS